MSIPNAKTNSSNSATLRAIGLVFLFISYNPFPTVKPVDTHLLLHRQMSSNLISRSETPPYTMDTVSIYPG